MKKGIHPKLVEATVVCACGNTFSTRSVKPLLKVEICSHCHPFFTGTQRIVDTAGQVERFMRRLGRAVPANGGGAEEETAPEANEQEAAMPSEEETTPGDETTAS